MYLQVYIYVVTWFTNRITNKGCDFNDDCREFIQSCFIKFCGLQQVTDCICVSIYFFNMFIRVKQKVKTDTPIHLLDLRSFKSSLKLHPLWVTLYLFGLVKTTLKIKRLKWNRSRMFQWTLYIYVFTGLHIFSWTLELNHHVARSNI